MPWSQTSAMDEKVRFISDYQRELLSLSELCDRYGISRKTGYKWIDRYETEGPRACGTCPGAPTGVLIRLLPRSPRLCSRPAGGIPAGGPRSC